MLGPWTGRDPHWPRQSGPKNKQLMWDDDKRRERVCTRTRSRPRALHSIFSRLDMGNTRVGIPAVRQTWPRLGSGAGPIWRVAMF
jgi:hypothetical protein